MCGRFTYNVLGGNPTVDPGAFYNFATQSIVPEPSTLILAALGGLALLAVLAVLAWRRP